MVITVLLLLKERTLSYFPQLMQYHEGFHMSLNMLFNHHFPGLHYPLYLGLTIFWINFLVQKCNFFPQLFANINNPAENICEYKTLSQFLLISSGWIPRRGKAGFKYVDVVKKLLLYHVKLLSRKFKPVIFPIRV